MLENFPTLITGILGIVVIDLVLSGDNAVVIGMAARRLPPTQRRTAIILGGAGAIGLRVLFAAIAAFLLTVPLLEAAGGVLLLWIAWKLLREGEASHDIQESVSIFGALKTIILADVVMSLDNILAIAGVSHGDISLLLFGLLLSMPLILFGSGLIATIMNRFQWLTLVGAGILSWTAGTMIVGDHIVGGLIPNMELASLLMPLLLTAAVLAPSIVGKLSQGRGDSPMGADGVLPIRVPLDRDPSRRSPRR